MNNSMVRRLVLKDWYFQRGVLLSYTLAGIASLWLLSLGSEGAFYAGSVLLVTIVISLGIHLIMVTVINERKEQTLPFVMSLPISYREYTAAKVVANLVIFLVPWTVITAGSCAVVVVTGIPDGLIPFVILVFTQLFAGYILTLAAAVITESVGWTIGAMVFGNLFIQYFMYAVSHNQAIAAGMKGTSVAWSWPAVSIMGAEVGVIVLLLALTFYMQARKKDFL
ncbi:MAG: ABC-2 transporter permease [Gemmatimonadota bacterium]